MLIVNVLTIFLLKKGELSVENEKRSDIGGQAVIKKMIRISKTHKLLIEERIKSVGLHRSLHMMLMYLSNCESTPSQKDLAAEFHISPAAVAATLKKLEADGYIEKALSEGDKRTKEISITEKGRDMVKRSYDIFRATDEEMLVGIEREELEKMYAVLEKITDNLVNMTKNSEK